MKQFKEFGIAPPEKGFSGDKIKIGRIINREVIIHKYKIVPSKFENCGLRLDLQLEINGQMYITWSSSKSLIETIKKIQADSFPFTTTIILENERYLFT